MRNPSVKYRCVPKIASPEARIFLALFRHCPGPLSLASGREKGRQIRNLSPGSFSEHSLRHSELATGTIVNVDFELAEQKKQNRSEDEKYNRLILSK